MASKDAVSVVNVEIRPDGDMYHAFSDELFGLYLTARSLDSLERDIVTACKYLLGKNGRDNVSVSPVSGKFAVGYSGQVAAFA